MLLDLHKKYVPEVKNVSPKKVLYQKFLPNWQNQYPNNFVFALILFQVAPPPISYSYASALGSFYNFFTQKLDLRHVLY